MSKYKEIEQFVIENGFVSPEKITAVDLYGLDKAKKLFENGKPSLNMLEELRIIACKNALSGTRVLNKDNFV